MCIPYNLSRKQDDTIKHRPKSSCSKSFPRGAYDAWPSILRHDLKICGCTLTGSIIGRTQLTSSILKLLDGFKPAGYCRLVICL
ncbi:unnamed protein product [Adineta ricciae]|uniref:Uncharacterized protein n=1 Tax=Adineta ricciae TaxID=249248 RepID=A0A813SDG9_ADIRI|nr:unnamed protein product [Adineta ricciae]